MKTFFIAGVQRSGTTLLSVLLSNHPAILLERRSIAFRVITCFKNMKDLWPHNLDVSEKEFTEWLVRTDIDGRLSELLGEQTLKDYASIRELIDTSIQNKLHAADKTVWGDKSPNLQYYTANLMTLMPDTKILHIVRDGRANANSMSRRSSRHLSWSAQHWVDGNIAGIVNRQILGADNYKIIRYEDLMQSPEKVLRSVCEFLEIDYAPEMMQLTDSELEGGERYVKSYFDKNKIDEWKGQLSDRAVQQIETIQGPLLKKLGYELMTPTGKLKYRPLSLARRIFYNQLDNFKTLFRSKRVGMKNREQVLIHISLKSRMYNYLRVLTQDFVAHPIFSRLFSRVFYKEKHYRKPKPTTKNELKI